MNEIKQYCNICDKGFTREDNLKRHIKEFHGSARESMEEQFPRKPQEIRAKVLKHPFCMIISGPSGSGKTYLVKDLLENGYIKPAPDRIIWVYKRWQRLYEEMNRSVMPKIEFVRGIPYNLDDESYINPEINNLIILDDVMLDAVKDPHVASLFTEGKTILGKIY
jgi:ABC-type glutathione transport system ATPase component